MDSIGTIFYFVLLLILILIGIGIFTQLKSIIVLFFQINNGSIVKEKIEIGKYCLIQGIVQPEAETFISPIAQKSCVYYKTFIEEYHPKQIPKTILDKEEVAPFSIRSNQLSITIQASAPVEESSLQVFVSQIKKTISYFSKADSKLKEQLIHLGIDVSKYESLTINLSVFESSLSVGEQVYLLAFLNESILATNTINTRERSTTIYISESIPKLKTNIFDSFLVNIGLFLGFAVFGIGVAYLIAL